MPESFNSTLWKIREAVYLRLYPFRSRIIGGLRVLSFLVSLTAVIAMIYYHGFEVDAVSSEWVTLIVRASLGFFVFKYVLRLLVELHPLDHLRNNWLEGLLIGLIALNGLSRSLFGFPLITRFGEWLDLTSLDLFLLWFLQAYLLVMVVIELGKASSLLSNIGWGAPELLISSFVLLIAIGTALLMLPEMTAGAGSASFQDALFTAISASCVTGLTIQPTGSFFSHEGHVVILLLMQLGGLNIITFASFFALFNRNKLGIRQQAILQQNFNIENLDQTENLFPRIFSFSLLIEGIGTLLLYFSWGDLPFADRGDRLFASLFHSVSAFNNAGFSLYADGLATTPLNALPGLHMIVAVLIVMGALGFPVMTDLFSLKRWRRGKTGPRQSLQLGNRVALYMTLVLIFLGAFFFLWSEWEGALQGKDSLAKIQHAFFQSITTRTAGFNTLDIGALGLPSLMFFLLLMFIGASPGSTGGGIKTTTFSLLLLAVVSSLRGRTKLELFRSTLPFSLLHKAFLIFAFSLGTIFTATLLLCITDSSFGLAALLFESTSAFCTVGLSTGITSSLSEAGRCAIMGCMFIGRVGTLVLAFTVGQRKEKTDYAYPEGNMMVG